MTELLTAAQMRAIEAAAIASGEVTGLELMERAGRGVVEAIFEEWPELKATSHRAVVLCGPGNNGGDGFVVARLLKEWGWEVEVYLYGAPLKLPRDARSNYQRWRFLGEALSAEEYDDETLEAGDLLIDALFGTGLRGPLPAELWAFCETARNAAVDNYKVVAIDVPSGLCSDSGRILHQSQHSESNDWQAIDADLTVTFHKEKLGHLLSYGSTQSCAVRTVDIGLEAFEKAMRQGRHGSDARFCLVTSVGNVDRDAIGMRQSLLPKENWSNKYTHGHALILSGGAGRGGAARLAARGALRIGAGLVTVGCPPEAVAENAARLDAVMLRPVADADAFGRVLEDKRVGALCLGPGLGTGEREAALVAAALGLRNVPPPPPPSAPHEGEASRRDTGAAPGGRALSLPPVGREEGRGAPRAVVLDADALTILAREPGLFAALHDKCVLTPHAGEFARLFPDIAEKLAAPATKGPAYSKVDATREAAARAGCVVLFKGPDTVIADPSGRCSINSAYYERAAPWLATAGSGDVLAGFIAGLLARGFPPMQAAETAAWLHVECALSFGPGLIAEDLPEELPKVFRALGL